MRKNYQANWLWILSFVLLVLSCGQGVSEVNTAQPITTPCPKVVKSVAFSPDGTILASASEKVWLWQAADGTAIGTLEGHTGLVQSVAFSPDGKVLASGANDDSVRLWQMADGTQLYELHHGASVESIVFSPDGTKLASGARDGSIKLWRVEDGRLLYTKDEQGSSRTMEVLSVKFSPDGAILASGSSDFKIRLWQVTNGTLIQVLEGHSGSVESLDFAPDGGETLVSASIDRTIKLWNVSEGLLQHSLNADEFNADKPTLDWPRVVTFSPDGEMFVSGGEYGHITLWQTSDRTFQDMGGGHGGEVTGLAFSPDGKTLASASLDGVVKLWRISDKEMLHDLSHGYFEHCGYPNE